jgi:hypothetical protein
MPILGIGVLPLAKLHLKHGNSALHGANKIYTVFSFGQTYPMKMDFGENEQIFFFYNKRERERERERDLEFTLGNGCKIAVVCSIENILPCQSESYKYFE